MRGKRMDRKPKLFQLVLLGLSTMMVLSVDLGAQTDQATGLTSGSSSVKGMRILEEVTRGAEVYGLSYFIHHATQPLTAKTNVRIREDYILGPGDVLLIKISGITNEQFRVEVNARGVVSFSNIPSVFVNGLSLLEAREKIRSRLLNVYKNVDIEVDVVDLKDIDVYVSGRVAEPGSYVVRANNTLMDLLYLCGGPTAEGSFRDIRLIKKVENQLDGGGFSVGERVIDLYNLFIFGEFESIILSAGDRIIVPPVNKVVTISGAVKNPARYEFINPLTLEELLGLAGGFTPNASASRIELSRKDQYGFYEFFELDYTDEKIPVFPIQDGDIVHVLDRITVIQEDHIIVTMTGRVKRPGRYILPQNSTFDDAIAAAGGLTDTAFESGSMLIREHLKTNEQLIREKVLQDLQSMLLTYQSNLAESAILNDDQALLLKAQQYRGRALNTIGQVMVEGRLLFDPERENPILHQGDVIRVPDTPNTVMVIGSVYNAGSLIYDEKFSVNDYLNLVGGLTPFADGDNIHILKPYGYVFSYKDKNVKIGRGDIVIVPPKIDMFTPGLTGQNP